MYYNIMRPAYYIGARETDPDETNIDQRPYGRFYETSWTIL